MYFVISLLAWSVATFIILGGTPEPIAGVSTTLLYFLWYTPAPELTLRFWDLRFTSPHGHERGGLYFSV